MLPIFLLALLAFSVGLSQADCDPNKMVPIATRFSSGFDSQKADFLDLPIFKWTCDQGNTFTPANHPEVVWQVPDQLAINHEAQQTQRADDNLCVDFSDQLAWQMKAFSWSIHIPTYVGVLSFAESKESGWLHELMTSRMSYTSSSRHEWKLMSGEIYPDFMLKFDDTFQQLVDMLPASINSVDDVNTYNQVIQYYGTHRATIGTFGGSYHFYSVADQSSFQQHDKSWCQEQFSISFFFYTYPVAFGLNYSKQQLFEQMDQQFQESLKTREFYRGGDLGLQQNTTIDQWAASLPLAPDYIDVTFSYLYLLIKDPAKQAALKKLTLFYEQYGCLPTDVAFTPCTSPAHKHKHKLPKH